MNTQKTELTAKQLENEERDKKFLYNKFHLGMTQADAYSDAYGNTASSKKALGALASRKMGEIKHTKVFQSMLGKAFQNMEKLMNSQNESIMLKATESVLDRGIGKVTQGLDHTSQGEKVGFMINVADMTGAELAQYLKGENV